MRSGLLLLGLIALIADLLASDLPLLCRTDGTLHVLPCLSRPAALSGEDNQSLRWRGWVLAPPVPYGPRAHHPGGVSLALSPPSRAHWLGTDDRGRDVLSRLLHGTRAALLVGVGSAILALVLGVGIGLAARLARVAAFAVERLVEVGLVFPGLFLLLCLRARYEGSTWALILTLALTRWPVIARLVESESRRQLGSPHVEAARALGLSRLAVLCRHVLPFVLGPALAAATLVAAQAILLEASLTFLGLGLAPPTPSWGELLQQAHAAAMPAWLLWPPTLALSGTVLALASACKAKPPR